LSKAGVAQLDHAPRLRRARQRGRFLEADNCEQEAAMPEASKKGSEMKKRNEKENDLEGAQDQGGKHGGQAGVPKPTPRPADADQDENRGSRDLRTDAGRTRRDKTGGVA
jgi:hypothetical protein